MGICYFKTWFIFQHLLFWDMLRWRILNTFWLWHSWIFNPLALTSISFVPLNWKEVLVFTRMKSPGFKLGVNSIYTAFRKVSQYILWEDSHFTKGKRKSCQYGKNHCVVKHTIELRYIFIFILKCMKRLCPGSNYKAHNNITCTKAAEFRDGQYMEVSWFSNNSVT